MDLSKLNIEELIQKEIERQVRQIVEEKLSNFTQDAMKKLGYNINTLVQAEVAKQIKKHFIETPINEIIESVGKNAIIVSVANAIKEEMVWRMEKDSSY